MSCFTNSPWNGDVGLVDSLPMGPKFSCDNIYLIVLPSCNLAIRYSNVLRVSPWAFQSMATMHSCNLVCWLLISPNPFRVIHEFNKELTPYNRYLDSKVAFANYLWPYLVNQERVSHCEKRSSAPWTEETLRIGEREKDIFVVIEIVQNISITI